MGSETTIMPGVEAYSAQGDRRGALIIHGFTGCPQSMRPLAEAFAAAGFTVELPRLPGHGRPRRTWPTINGATGLRPSTPPIGILLHARTKSSSPASRWAARSRSGRQNDVPGGGHRRHQRSVRGSRHQRARRRGGANSGERAKLSARGRRRRRRSKRQGARLRSRSRRHGQVTHGRCGGS